MAEHEHSEQQATEDQHVRETNRAELAEEEALARLQAQGPDADSDAATADRPNTSFDLGSGGGSTTADPGRQNPIIPGEGRL